jgi:hypothetical protein
MGRVAATGNPTAIVFRGCRSGLCKNSEGTSDGRNTEKTLPLLPEFLLLRTQIFPPCFFTISELTQSPSPVPFAPFVV